MGILLEGITSKVLDYLLFIPLYGLMANRYRRDDAVTLAPREWVFHPHGRSVVKVRY